MDKREVRVEEKMDKFYFQLMVDYTLSITQCIDCIVQKHDLIYPPKQVIKMVGFLTEILCDKAQHIQNLVDFMEEEK